LSRILAKGSIGYCAVPDVRDPASLLRQTALAKEAGFSMILVFQFIDVFRWSKLLLSLVTCIDQVRLLDLYAGL